MLEKCRTSLKNSIISALGTLSPWLPSDNMLYWSSGGSMPHMTYFMIDIVEDTSVRTLIFHLNTVMQTTIALLKFNQTFCGIVMKWESSHGTRSPPYDRTMCLMMMRRNTPWLDMFKCKDFIGDGYKYIWSHAYDSVCTHRNATREPNKLSNSISNPMLFWVY